MVRPSHPGNVGAAARAMKTMGFSQLVLVHPKDPNVRQHPDAIALASGASDVLDQARIVHTLEEALNGTTLSFALTSRHRDMGPPVINARECAELSSQHLHQNEAIAMVFGTERTGLENKEIALCSYICHIPANPEYSSLNVSQALQVLAWEVHYALLNHSETPITSSRQETPATHEQIQAFLKHWEQALIEIDFLNPKHPKKLIPRMQYLFSKSQLTTEEVAMLRGVCTQILKTKKHLNNQ
ncbi:RNA methyltransferase [Basilea psittacipulmonis DSM 24701]|uniref:tRNA (cytidine/uridine-2'-O-)-methyltransferase TrmJ n=2 Tax=Basilea TaxID=1472344 RepID=A0A077DDZ9_9BURK|nr:RNA methyltransferase [Basilea psittacipulmonis DSM 24701]